MMKAVKKVKYVKSGSMCVVKNGSMCVVKNGSICVVKSEISRKNDLETCL